MPNRMRYGRTPDTIGLLLVLAVLAGVAALADVPPGTIENAVSPAVARAWAVVLSLSSAIALAGVVSRDELIGWGLELGGRIGVGATMLGYWLVAITASWNSDSPLASSLWVGILASFTVTSAIRVWQLLRRWDEFFASLRAQRRRREAS